MERQYSKHRPPSPLVHAPMDLSSTKSHYGDDAVIAQALPGQTQHQGI
jgi:hypothetical protein